MSMKAQSDNPPEDDTPSLSEPRPATMSPEQSDTTNGAKLVAMDAESSSPRQDLTRIRALDTLRGIAVLLVLGRHLPFFQNPFLNSWMTVGWIGVDLFFVLSGFLISGLIFSEIVKTGSFDPVRFLIRRGFKIYPSYYAFLMLSWPAIAFVPGLITKESILSEVFFVSNYFPNMWWHTWSLCIEEHFYILLALAMSYLAMKRFKLSAVVPGCLFVMVMSLICRVFLIQALPHYDVRPHHVMTALRIDALAFGVVIRYWYQYGNFKSFYAQYRIPLLVVSTIMILPTAILDVKNPLLYTFGLTFLYMGLGVLLLAFLELPQDNSFLSKGLSVIGQASYSIYLWHMPWAWLCAHADFINPNPMVRLVMYFVLTALCAVLNLKLIEEPALRLRERLFAKKTTRRRAVC